MSVSISPPEGAMEKMMRTTPSPLQQAAPPRTTPNPKLAGRLNEDAMKASCTVRYRSSLFVAAAIAVSLMSAGLQPNPCLAKTRPPVEAGDPDIGNDKPRPSKATALPQSQSSTYKRSADSPFTRTGWFWALVYSRMGLRLFGRDI